MVGICALHVRLILWKVAKIEQIPKKVDLGDLPYFRISRLHLVEIQQSTTTLFTEESHNTLYRSIVIRSRWNYLNRYRVTISLPSYHIKILCNYKRYNSDTILYLEPFPFNHHPQFSRCQRGEGLWLLQCVPRGMRLVQRCVASMCRWPTRCDEAGVLETES